MLKILLVNIKKAIKLLKINQINYKQYIKQGAAKNLNALKKFLLMNL
jgi:hypothetical protein